MTYLNPSHWRLRVQRYRLTGYLCKHCGAMTFKPHQEPYRVCFKDSAPIEIKDPIEAFYQPTTLIFALTPVRSEGLEK
jgi:hypothetical protein